MPTIVDLTEQELAELKALTKQADITAAVRSAMTEYLRHARRMQLKALSGQVEMDNNWQSLEAVELRKADGDSKSGAH
ncbi:MAG: hypothetical protein JF612_00155 [Planctomycetia bacterium]|jgi:hypothetical protein|nr:hypothetical protein [Planctomycetia bacterium]